MLPTPIKTVGRSKSRSRTASFLRDMLSSTPRSTSSAGGEYEVLNNVLPGDEENGGGGDFTDALRSAGGGQGGGESIHHATTTPIENEGGSNDDDRIRPLSLRSVRSVNSHHSQYERPSSLRSTRSVNSHHSQYDPDHPRYRHRAPLWFQITYFIVLGTLFIYFLIDSFTTKKLYRVLEHLFRWIEEHYLLGPLVFISTVIIFSMILIPESALTVGGGYIFARAHGVILGVLLCSSLVFLGGFVGSVISFLIARHLCFDSVQRWGHRYRVLRAIDRSLEENGAKMVFLLRLSPFIPFNVLNYIMGVTCVALPDFMLGSFGMIPWVVTCAYIGSALKGVSDVAGASQGDEHGRSTKNRGLTYAAYGLGVAGTCAVLYVIGIYTRRAFEEVLREEPPASVVLAEEEEAVHGQGLTVDQHRQLMTVDQDGTGEGSVVGEVEGAAARAILIEGETGSSIGSTISSQGSSAAAAAREEERGIREQKEQEDVSGRRGTTNSSNRAPPPPPVGVFLASTSSTSSSSHGSSNGGSSISNVMPQQQQQQSGRTQAVSVNS